MKKVIYLAVILTIPSLVELECALWAQAPRPLGEEFQVNTYTPDAQRRASVAVKEEGDFVVVWHSLGSAETDNSGYSIQGQHFNSSGGALGSEFQVNEYTTSQQRWPSVGVDADGDFVVVWWSNGSVGNDNSDYSIQARRYNSSGGAQGSEFQVNQYTTSYQYLPALAVAAAGNFVVAWASNGSTGDDSSDYSIQARRYDSSGDPLADEFQVNGYTLGRQAWPSVAVDADGNCIIAWESDGSAATDNSDWSVQGQRYDSAGGPLGGEFQLNSYTTSIQRRPSVAIAANRDFVVSWESDGSTGDDNSGRSIQAQRYDSAGSVLGAELQVNTNTTIEQRWSSVTIDSTGNFVVVWHSGGGPASINYNIQGQRHDSSGNRLGNEFQVSTYTTSSQNRPLVAGTADGDFVVAWQSLASSGDDSSSWSIQARRYDTPLFVDGFESGNLSAWTLSVP
jgi:hypothetical protein